MELRRYDLWSGWSVQVPDSCEIERAVDGHWSAWDDRHVLDVHIIDVGGDAAGRPFSPEEMLGDAQGQPIALPGAIGRFHEDTELVHPEPVDWTHLQAAATNTVLMLSVGNASLRDSGWHRMIVEGVQHEDPV